MGKYGLVYEVVNTYENGNVDIESSMGANRVARRMYVEPKKLYPVLHGDERFWT